MNPNICISGLAFIVFLISACNSDSPISEENADPVLEEYPVVYIERSLDTDFSEEINQPARFPVFEPTTFNAGAKLYIKANATPEALVTELSADLFSGNDADNSEALPQAIDIRDLSVSPDGQEFLVSIRAPEIEDADDDEQPTWNIWRYQQDTKQLTRIIASDIIAEQGDDLMASFLPDGRIIFASNRQRLSRAILLDEGKPQYTANAERTEQAALNIHIMQADGSEIEQLTFNLSHDFYPLVLQDGHILYSRWDAMGGDNQINLYRMRPDGTENQLVYGWHSHQLNIGQETADVEFIKPQQLPNGNLLLLLNGEEDSNYQKRPIVINIADFTDQFQAIAANNPLAESALSELFDRDLTDYNFSENLSPSGRINHLFALPDSTQRYLVSWDLCRVVIEQAVRACGQLTPEQLAQGNLEQATPLYELWLFNQLDNTQQLVASTTQGNILTEAIVMQAAETKPEFIADKVVGAELDRDLAEQQAGAIHIRSVYDFDGIDLSPQGLAQTMNPSLTTAEERPARFLRIIRGVPMPPDEVKEVENTDFGRSRAQLMREILGYTPIQPDGSVKVKVPANLPFALSVLDQSGKRIGGRHRQWITVKPGETIECHGCHTGDSEQAHGRIAAQATSINAGAVAEGVAYPNSNPQLLPSFAETMAETLANVLGLPALSSDLSYQDIWSDPATAVLNPPLELSYQNITTTAPNGSECFTNWSAYCRLQINYSEHIQPLWSKSRLVFDEVTNEQIQDNTCTSCHNTLDADNVAQVPAGQLDLTAAPSNDEPAHLIGYRELFFPDVEQELIEGILVDRQVPLIDENGNPVYVRDSEGNLVLDENGQPIPVMTTVDVANILSTNGANASGRFFEVINSTDHQNMLSPDEQRLLSEWLDIGGQYYNTPFYQVEP
ncbi:MAG: hypothetical protein ACPG52_03820 [Cognaticolwellia sp.]